MAQVKKCKDTGNEFIVFKTPAPSVKDANGNWKETPNFVKKVLKCVDKHSVPFMGIKLSEYFQEANGDWKLYGTHTICVDGYFFHWTGVDTENWKGFSVKIIKAL